jgi:hypothetical protein
MSTPSAFGDVTNCRACGARVLAAAEVCPTCGVRQWGMPAPAWTTGMDLAGGRVPVASEHRVLPAVLLCLFFGFFGAHRFYVGKTRSAIVQLLTLGGLGVWALADLILIATGEFRDGEGRRVTRWP